MQKEPSESELQQVIAKASDAFCRSQEDAVETITTKKSIECPKCNGKEDLIDNCILCVGEGEIVEKTTVEKRKTRAGDSSHLRVMMDCVKQSALIEGIVSEFHQHDTNIETVNVAEIIAEIKREVPGWAEACDKELLAEYEEDVAKAQAKLIESNGNSVLDVQGTKHAGNGASY